MTADEREQVVALASVETKPTSVRFADVPEKEQTSRKSRFTIDSDDGSSSSLPGTGNTGSSDGVNTPSSGQTPYTTPQSVQPAVNESPMVTVPSRSSPLTGPTSSVHSEVKKGRFTVNESATSQGPPSSLLGDQSESPLSVGSTTDLTGLFFFLVSLEDPGIDNDHR